MDGKMLPLPAEKKRIITIIQPKCECNERNLNETKYDVCSAEFDRAEQKEYYFQINICNFLKNELESVERGKTESSK